MVLHQPDLGAAVAMSVLGLDLETPGHLGRTPSTGWPNRPRRARRSPATPGVMVCTHLVHGPQARVAISVAGVDPDLLPGDNPLDAAVASAVAVEHQGRRSGRGGAVFEASKALVGVVSVGDVLTRSVIERVVVLGGPPPGIDALGIETRDFVRPQWKDGLLTLIHDPGPGRPAGPVRVPRPEARAAAGHGTDHGRGVDRRPGDVIQASPGPMAEDYPSEATGRARLGGVP